MIYSPIELAFLALALLATAVFIERHDDNPTIGRAVILGTVFIVIGAFVLVFINMIGPLP